jgi:hypothetical protein
MWYSLRWKSVALLLWILIADTRAQVPIYTFSYGDQPQGSFGSSVAGVGDLDGNGLTDVVVGADYEGPGVVYVIGANGLLYSVTTPDPEPQWGVNVFGRALSPGGDVDGDGRSDFIVGAPGDADGCGRAYLFSGATGTLLLTLAATECSDDPFANSFGWETSSAGDVNADGIPDIAVGNFAQEVGGQPYAGRAYVFSGNDGGPLAQFESPSPGGYLHFGVALASVGDVNEDSIPDLLVGANWDRLPEEPSEAGRAYLFSGAGGSPLLAFRSPGAATSGWFGSCVSNAGDLDLDGVQDLLIGAPGEPSGGRAYVFSGATGAHLFTLQPPTTLPGQHFGSALAVWDDRDGDNIPDLLVGAPYTDTSIGNNRGRAYLFSGRTGTPIGFFDPPSSPVGSAYFGYSLADAGDMNGDGSRDVIIGAPGLSDFEGAAYVFSSAMPVGIEPGMGGPSGFVLDVPYPDPFAIRTTIPFMLTSPMEVRIAVYDLLGREVAVLADGPYPPGRHEATLEGHNLPSSVLLVRMTTGDGSVRTRRVVSIR